MATTPTPTRSLRTKSRGRWLIAGSLALTVAGALASGAGATQPGQSGAIAFRRYVDARHTAGAVFTIGSDGTGERQLTTPPQGTLDDQPDWAPDGSLITFTRCGQGGPCHIFVVAPDGSGMAPVGAPCPEGADEQTCSDDSRSSFSPDSQRLTFIQATGTVRNDASGGTWIEHSAVTIMNRDGSGRRVIYQGAPFSGDFDFPVISPDGKQILFDRIASGFAPHPGHRAIFVMRLDGTHVRKLTPWAENDGDNPDWSPDGNWIVFQSHYADGDVKQSQLYLIHPDGSGRRQLTHFAEGTNVASSSFSPDGKWLAISKGTASGNLHVFALRLADGSVRRVTHSQLWDSAPDWGPR
jgi:TolB protein